MDIGGTSRRRRRLWRFADAEFDEAGWTLRVDGRAVPLEGKPLEVLHELLLHAGEVVSKDELLDAVWPGVTVVENSLANAVSKLRKGLGEAGDTIVAVVCCHRCCCCQQQADTMLVRSAYRLACLPSCCTPLIDAASSQQLRGS